MGNRKKSRERLQGTGGMVRRFHKRFLLVCFLLLVAAAPAGLLALNSDGNTLLAFKRSIFSDPEESMKDWDVSDATPCRWSGVSCATIRGESEPRVEGLVLSKKQLVGSMSDELGSLPYLARLNLRENQLIGGIPAALFNATSLKSLLLSGNDLSGPLPASIQRLAGSLEALDLSGNGLSGDIPDSISACGQLETLILSSNRLTGSIPSGFGTGLKLLQRLDLSNNMLAGLIPEDLGDLGSLQGTLNLSANNLSGAIPASLGRLPISLSIDLSYNNLSGPIPLNGTLSNQGPTAFLGNPSLCGMPLKSKCEAAGEEPARMPFFGTPGSSSQQQRRPPPLIGGRKQKSGLSVGEIVAIAVGDAVGILLIASAFGYCYWKSKQQQQQQGEISHKQRRRCIRGEQVSSSCCCCCGSAAPGKDGFDSNSDTEEGAVGAGGGDEHELLHFGEEAGKVFNLDALLRASAYVLGKGKSGIVYKAVLEGGTTLVVRRLGDGGGARRIKEFEAEVKAISAIRHPNVVPLLAYYWGMNEKLLVYDFLPNGSLADALQQHQHHLLLQQQRQGTTTSEEEQVEEAPLSWPQRLNIAKGISKGLAHLHEGTARRNIHGNIKPSNILLDSKLQPGIADFGIARLAEILASHDTSSSSSLRSASDVLGNKSSRSNTEIAATSTTEQLSGEPNHQMGSTSSSNLSLYSASASVYRPPEALPNSRPTQKWDVYSFGVVLLEMLTGSASAQLASSDVDMVASMRRMLLTCKGAMLMAGIHAEAEAMEMLEVAMRCVSAAPEHRPKMKHVADALHRIAPVS